MITTYQGNKVQRAVTALFYRINRQPFDHLQNSPIQPMTVGPRDVWLMYSEVFQETIKIT